MHYSVLPEDMTPTERFGEIVCILASTFSRLRYPNSHQQSISEHQYQEPCNPSVASASGKIAAVQKIPRDDLTSPPR